MPIDHGAFLVNNYRVLVGGRRIRLCGMQRCLQFCGVFGLEGMLEVLKIGSSLFALGSDLFHCFPLGLS